MSHLGCAFRCLVLALVKGTEKVNSFPKCVGLPTTSGLCFAYPAASVEPLRALPCRVSPISFFPLESLHSPESKRINLVPLGSFSVASSCSHRRLVYSIC